MRSKPQTPRAGRWRESGLAARPIPEASTSRDIEARGSDGPPASRAPSDFSESDETNNSGRKSCRENDGGCVELEMDGDEMRLRENVTASAAQSGKEK